MFALRFSSLPPLSLCVLTRALPVKGFRALHSDNPRESACEFLRRGAERSAGLIYDTNRARCGCDCVIVRPFFFLRGL